MKTSSSRVLLLLTLLAAGAALWLLAGGDDEQPAPEGVGEALVPALTAGLNDVDQVIVEGDSGPFTLQRLGGEWFVQEWGFFPADFSKVKELVVGVEQLVLLEPKTKRPDRWEALGLRDPGPDHSSVRVQLTASGERLADVVVGRQKGRDAVYVRRYGEPQTWLAKGRLAPGPLASRFVTTDLVDMTDARMQRVLIEHPDGETVTLGREAGESDGPWSLEEMTDEQELLPNSLAPLARVLSRLMLESVMPEETVQAAAPEWTNTRFETNDGVALTLKSASIDGKTVARFAAGALPDDSATSETEGPSLEPAPTDEPRDPAEIAAEVADLNARLSKWTYVLPSWKAGSIGMRLSDLVQAKEVDQPDEDDAAIGGESVDATVTDG